MFTKYLRDSMRYDTNYRSNKSSALKTSLVRQVPFQALMLFELMIKLCWDSDNKNQK